MGVAINSSKEDCLPAACAKCPSRHPDNAVAFVEKSTKPPDEPTKPRPHQSRVRRRPITTQSERPHHGIPPSSRNDPFLH
ncbi:hypothetical protein Tco_0128376 [Tanacetum coccineum]